MAHLTIVNSKTGETVVSTSASNGAGHLRRLLLDARRPVIEAKVREAGKEINTISVVPAADGNWLLRETGERFTITYKTFIPQRRTASEPGGRMVEVFDGMKGFALPEAEANAYRRNRG